VALAVGVAGQVEATSGSYWRTVDRGFAALAGPLAQASGRSAAVLSSFLAGAPGMDRETFFATLDRLAADTATTLRRFAGIVPPWPGHGAAAGCVAAMDERGRAVASLRQALEGVLGGRSGTGGGDEAAAAGAMAGAGATLVSADVSWASCRLALHRTPGHPWLPASVWVTDPGAWSAASAGAFVAAVVGSPTLAAVHRLSVTAVSTEPPSLAGTGSSQAPAVVAPTTALRLVVVVDDEGNVDEPGLVVSVVADSPGGPPQTVRATAALGAGGAVAVDLPPLRVTPGSSLTLQVSAVPATGQGAASTSFALVVAAATTPGAGPAGAA